MSPSIEIIKIGFMKYLVFSQNVCNFMTMKKLLFYTFLFCSLIPQPQAHGYILPSNVILEKLVENSGSGSYVLNQEVVFSNVTESLVVKESWAIENEHSFRLTATAIKDGLSLMKIHRVYKDGYQYQLVNSRPETQKISNNFFEHLFFARSADYLIQVLKMYEILPPNYTTPKVLQKSNTEFKYENESFLRFSRAGGTPAYAFGAVSTSDQEKSSGLWIEQDAFVIKKIRLPSQVEIIAENYVEYSRGFKYPKGQMITWNNNTATVKTLSISAKSHFSKSVMKTDGMEPTSFEGLQASSLKDVVIDFYTRLR